MAKAEGKPQAKLSIYLFIKCFSMAKAEGRPQVKQFDLWSSFCLSHLYMIQVKLSIHQTTLIIAVSM